MSIPTTYPAPVLDQARQPQSKWRREYNAFLRLLPSLLQTHQGQYVAVHEEQVVDSGDNKIEVVLRAYAKFGYIPIYVGLVAPRPLPPERIPKLKNPGAM